jgi:uncharacterized membrane protein
MRSPTSLVILAAAILGIAYAVVLPPFEVPDEVLHFWRPLIISGGQFMPQRPGAPDAGNVPLGIQNLIFVMISQKQGEKTTRDQLRVAYRSPLEYERPKVVRYPAMYTPVPYLPQSLAGIAMRLFRLRPFFIFYLGRLLNLAAALALIAAAMRAAPELGPKIAAVALLPMTLGQFASWSSDAVTIALAVLLTALLFAERAPRTTILVAFLLALCKPAYFLIALLAIATRYRRSTKIAIIGASAAGTILAVAYARIGTYAIRMSDPVNPSAQIRCLIDDPMRFVRALGRDIPEHGWMYLTQIAGVFGGVAQFALPSFIPIMEIVLLVAVALTGRAKGRALALGIVAVSVVGIFLSQFLIWSIACGEVIEGVQGRYFLPLLPLALTIPAIPRLRSLPVGAVVVVGVVCNVFALVVIGRHFW